MRRVFFFFFCRQHILKVQEHALNRVCGLRMRWRNPSRGTVRPSFLYFFVYFLLTFRRPTHARAAYIDTTIM